MLLGATGPRTANKCIHSHDVVNLPDGCTLDWWHELTAGQWSSPKPRLMIVYTLPFCAGMCRAGRAVLARSTASLAI